MREQVPSTDDRGGRGSAAMPYFSTGISPETCGSSREWKTSASVPWCPSEDSESRSEASPRVDKFGFSSANDVPKSDVWSGIAKTVSSASLVVARERRAANVAWRSLSEYAAS